jgi:hypothetical protein
VAVSLVLLLAVVSNAQQAFRLPDLSTMKHMTTRQTDRAPDIPGKETTMDYYTAADGNIFTIYSYRGRRVAFSVHSNNDVENTYRIFLDTTGNGVFQEINRATPWQLPGWAR